MREFESIKEFYKPIQPAIKAENRGIVYREIRPGKKIENFVYCYWQLKTLQPLEKPFIYRVVSDGCIDIFFDHKQPAESFVMGFCRKFTEFPIGRHFDYIGIRFLPSAFPLLFGVNAKDLSNQSQELNNVLPGYSHWIKATMGPQQSFEEVVALFNGRLGKHIQNRKTHFDPRFLKALTLIFQKKGFLNTEIDLNTGLSPRQLRRIFNFYIGTTPKAFSNVARFQHILNANPSKQSLKETRFYFDVGYFDQAHFIKDFKIFYGVTPSEAFR